MVRTPQTVDRASCCSLGAAELPFGSVSSPLSSAACDYCSVSRCDTRTGIPQRCADSARADRSGPQGGPGLCSLRPQSLHRQSPLLRRRDFAVLFLLVQVFAVTPATSYVSGRKETERVGMADWVGRNRFLCDAPTDAVGIVAAPSGSNVLEQEGDCADGSAFRERP